ncbi:RNA polymerase sigma factor [Tamlana sp. 2_MG-2023]|uniref:RNA polymerase sigma factor n=1 Tax=unclassified Tamlana TaxID=2614803 RepID=UPI0026E3DDCB|nr:MULTISPECIES: RNA polymerase sigma factor [unclassified Tamlana]MDO6760082.1 RNA polymerase sigma factor [Tamlana sp. 2_MG-2023]MDO6790220.1 RNA polymerase sigma factor [Tamlana sp. 1_MG-2023]
MIESEFIKGLKSENANAYAKLLEDFQQKVFATCISFIPNKEDAEDVAQDVFIEIFKSIHKFKGDSKLSTWIYRIATNKCLEFIRKRNTKKRFAFMQSILGHDMPLDRSNYFTELNHPGIILENKEQSETLFRAVNKLSEDQKVVFTLHKIDGKSYQEISEIVDKSLSSVESLMFRAKKSLQKLLTDYYENEMN